MLWKISKLGSWPFSGGHWSLRILSAWNQKEFQQVKVCRKCHNHNSIKQTFSSTTLHRPASSNSSSSVNSSIFNTWSSSPFICLLQMGLCLRITMWYVMEKVNGSMIIVWTISSLKTAKVLFSSYRKFQSEIL